MSCEAFSGVYQEQILLEHVSQLQIRYENGRKD